MFRKRLSGAISVLMCIILLFTCTTAFAAGKPKIKEQPQSQTVSVGGTCKFYINHSGATGITWRLYNPETEETVLCSKAASRFKGLKVSGQNSKTLKLSKVPEELDGWQVFCTLNNKSGNTESDYVWLFVGGNGAEKLASAKAASDQLQDSNNEISISVENGTVSKLDKKGNPTGKSAKAMTLKSSESVRISANEKDRVLYWSVNGEKIPYSEGVYQLSINQPSKNLVIEIVYTQKESKATVKQNTSSEVDDTDSERDANINDGYVYTGNIGGPLKTTDYAENNAKGNKKYKITCDGCTFVDNTKKTESATSGSVKQGNLVTFHAESKNGGDQYYWSYQNKITKTSAYAVTVNENIDITCVPMYKMKYSGCTGEEYAMHGYILTVKPDFDGECKVEVFQNKTLLDSFSANGPFEYIVTQKVKFVCTQN